MCQQFLFNFQYVTDCSLNHIYLSDFDTFVFFSIAYVRWWTCEPYCLCLKQYTSNAIEKYQFIACLLSRLSIFQNAHSFFLAPIKTRSAQRRNNSKIRAGSHIIQKKSLLF